MIDLRQHIHNLEEAADLNWEAGRELENELSLYGATLQLDERKEDEKRLRKMVREYISIQRALTCAFHYADHLDQPYL